MRHSLWTWTHSGALGCLWILWPDTVISCPWGIVFPPPSSLNFPRLLWTCVTPLERPRRQLRVQWRKWGDRSGLRDSSPGQVTPAAPEQSHLVPRGGGVRREGTESQQAQLGVVTAVNSLFGFGPCYWWISVHLIIPSLGGRYGFKKTKNKKKNLWWFFKNLLFLLILYLFTHCWVRIVVTALSWRQQINNYYANKVKAYIVLILSSFRKKNSECPIIFVDCQSSFF